MFDPLGKFLGVIWSADRLRRPWVRVKVSVGVGSGNYPCEVEDAVYL